MLASARLTLKQHRFEIVSVVVAALIVGAAALWINMQLLGFAVPAGCFDAWLDERGSPGPECREPVAAYSNFLYSNISWYDPAVLVLPFIVGTLSGVPLVARELESRTAQTAWALSPSRHRWLTRQIWPTLLVVGAAIAFAAVAASLLADTRNQGFPSDRTLSIPGLSGPLIVARALLAFSVGVPIGALVGRSMPAMILTALACLFLVTFGAISARDAWLRAQPHELITEVDLATGQNFTIYQPVWIAPDGSLVPYTGGFEFGTPGVEDPDRSFLEAGYEMAWLGLKPATVGRWDGIEILGTFTLGAVLVGSAYPIVNRRRPA